MKVLLEQTKLLARCVQWQTIECQTVYKMPGGALLSAKQVNIVIMTHLEKIDRSAVYM